MTSSDPVRHLRGTPSFPITQKATDAPVALQLTEGAEKAELTFSTGDSPAWTLTVASDFVGVNEQVEVISSHREGANNPRQFAVLAVQIDCMCCLQNRITINEG